MEKISELIARLRAFQEEHGDLTVLLVNEDGLAEEGIKLDVKAGPCRGLEPETFALISI